jgi:hypothetical protein
MSQKTYPLGDTPTSGETGGAEFNKRFASEFLGGSRNFRAVFTGEKRPPRKGEWYLSGSIITAYKAPNDLSTPYHIARLVRVETKNVTIERVYELTEKP